MMQPAAGSWRCPVHIPMELLLISRDRGAHRSPVRQEPAMPPLIHRSAAENRARRRRFWQLAAGLLLAMYLGGPADAAAINVACVGDSITYGSGASDPATKSYPAVLAGLLGGGYAVGNFGHGGTTLLKSGDFPYWNVAEF